VRSDILTTEYKTLFGFGLSDKGRVRANNEDLFYCDNECGIFIVIDGMGGHAAGEYAANIALQSILNELKNSSADDAETKLRNAITQANNDIFNQSQEHHEWSGMACVLTVALVEDGVVTIGHVGDTRLYLLDDNRIKKITRDHSLVAALEEKFVVTEIEAMRHPQRNVVTRDVGTQLRHPFEDSFIDVYKLPFDKDEMFLLCSDGLTDMLTSKQILEIVDRYSDKPKKIVESLIEAANNAGGKDNITIVLFGEETQHNWRNYRGITFDSALVSPGQDSDMATIYKRANDKAQKTAWTPILSSRWGELLGLFLATILTVFGLFLVEQAKTTNPDKTSFVEADEQLKNKQIVNLNRVSDESELANLLTTFDNEADRKFAARKIIEYVTKKQRKIENVGSLSQITVEREEIDKTPDLVSFKERLKKIREDETTNPPKNPNQPIVLLTQFSQIKQNFIVRTPEDFKSNFLLWAAISILVFYLIHIIWRFRGFKGDGFLLPIVHLLSGFGLILMVTLRDPLRDNQNFSDFSLGLIIGCVFLLAASLIDFHTLFSKWTWTPLFAAISLSLLLIIFGKGPGNSDAKVNLWIFQPIEFIKILLVFFMAAYFAENWEYLRHLKQKGGGLLALLRQWNAPRLAEILPVTFAMVVSLGFFFAQKDLGPALIMGCTFLALYALARRRAKAVLAGLLILVAGIFIGYKFATPFIVFQRIHIWLDVWDNGLRNGDQIAHAWWGMASGSVTGTGLGLGEPSLIPAGHTDLVLASLGEELGFAGVAIVLIFYSILIAKCFQIALRARSDYLFFLSLGLTLILAFEIALITSGVLGLFPLSGVVSPFLSYGKSSMIANCFIIGVLLSVSSQQQEIRESTMHNFGFPLKVVTGVFVLIAILLVGKAAYIQLWKADEFAISPVLTKQKDNNYRYLYNPRLLAAAQKLQQGTVYDRNGIPLATSDWKELEKHRKDYEVLGINIDAVCKKEDKRHYPFGNALFYFLGNAITREKWAAKNADFIEREYDWRLRGFDDRPEKVFKTVVEIDRDTKQVTTKEVEVIKRDLTEILPLMRYRYRPGQSDYQSMVERERDIKTSLDIRLQLRLTETLRLQLAKQKKEKGAAVVMDATTGEVLAMVSFPLLPDKQQSQTSATVSDDDAFDESDYFNRALFGSYAPGSTFKIVTAIAALRKDPNLANVRHECKPLGDGRVGNYVKGWGRPLRDDAGDRAHGQIGLEDGIVYSCNAYFGQLGVYDVGASDLFQTANLFEIKAPRLTDEQRQKGDSPIKVLNDDLPWSSFGQGQIEASPFQMARVAATIANNGVMPYGKFVIDDSNKRTNQPVVVLNPNSNTVIARAMRGVVERGTAAKLNSIKPPISGKTGTAQVENGEPHSWFIGFAQISSTRKIAFAVIIENGGYGSSSAAPIAGEICRK
jgi:cell division protein FtsI/penicillin-binding protein 2/serine/threonine protein phosphatase PrpC